MSVRTGNIHNCSRNSQSKLQEDEQMEEEEAKMWEIACETEHAGGEGEGKEISFKGTLAATSDLT